MDNNTLVLILTFLSAQIAAVLAFWRWSIEIKQKLETNAQVSQLQRTEIRDLVVQLLAELGYSRIATNGSDQAAPLKLAVAPDSKEIQ